MNCTLATGSYWRRGWIRQIEKIRRLRVNRHCTEFSSSGRLPEDAARNTMLESTVSCFDTGSNLAANWKQAHICLSRQTVSGRQCIFNAKDTSSTKSLFLKVCCSG